ncbi:MAG: hypothetical protein OJJ55_18670 [Rhodococcus sp.]|nr:hypothetical protein [Rhodococcus sp. (in: high G+C Gram-positive bacteria)]
MDADSKAGSHGAYELGVKAERERVVSILGSTEAEGRLPVAMQCIQFGLAYGASIDLLKVVPKQASAVEQRTSDFAAAILGSPEAEGRLPVAMLCIQFGLAYGASMDLLKAVPKQASAVEQRTSDFATTMAAIGSPRVAARLD